MVGKISAAPIACHPRRAPMRNDTSAKPSRSNKRATTEAVAGVHIRARTHDTLPLIMRASNTADNGPRTEKYMISPRRARSLVALPLAGNGGDVVTLNYVLSRCWPHLPKFI